MSRVYPSWSIQALADRLSRIERRQDNQDRRGAWTYDDEGNGGSSGDVVTKTGTATVASGTTYEDVPHNLTVIPASGAITVSPANSVAAATDWWLSNFELATFRINVAAAPTEHARFHWHGHVVAAPLPTDGPASIAGLQYWFDAQVLDLGDGASIALWDDLSGNNLDLEQPTSGQQPIYVASAINSLPAVRFDGTDDRMRLLTPDGVKAATAKTIFAVYQGRAGGNYNLVISTRLGPDGESNQNGGYIFLTDDSPQRILYTQIAATDVTATTTESDGVPYAVALRTADNGTDVSIRKGGAEQPLSGTTTGLGNTEDAASYTSVGNQGGTGGWGSFDLGEVFAYDRRLSDLEVAEMESYLSDRWGL